MPSSSTIRRPPRTQENSHTQKRSVSTSLLSGQPSQKPNLKTQPSQNLTTQGPPRARNLSTTPSGLRSSNDIPKPRRIPEKNKLPPITANNILNTTQPSLPVRRANPRVSKVWQHPSELKMRGLWQQYEDEWFRIQFELVVPLFDAFPLPVTKSLNDLPQSMEEIKDEPEEPVQEVLEKQPKDSRTNLLSTKLKKIEEDLIPCSKCKEKKRKGARISCDHYFCRECLRDHIQDHIDNMKVPIRCLIPECHYELERKEIVKHAANSENIMKYFDLNVTDFVNRRPHKMVLCFTPGCKCVIDMSKSKMKNMFRCPRCKSTYCLACHQPMKKGHSCEDANVAESMKDPLRQILNAKPPVNV